MSEGIRPKNFHFNEHLPGDSDAHQNLKTLVRTWTGFFWREKTLEVNPSYNVIKIKPT